MPKSKRPIVQISNQYEEAVDIDDEGAETVQDGGWGWFVVMAAFTSRVVMDGIGGGYEDLFEEVIETFDGEEGDSKKLETVTVLFYFVAGPVAGMLINRFSCRSVTILGGALGAIGLLLTKFAPSVAFLYFSVGLLAGFGSGCIHITSLVVVSLYFRSCRALMTGVAVCGSSLGALVLQPRIAQLIEKYGWRSTSLILAGVLLVTVGCGLMYRPLVSQEDQAGEGQGRDEVAEKEMKGEGKDAPANETGGKNKDGIFRSLVKSGSEIARNFRREKSNPETDGSRDIQSPSSSKDADEKEVMLLKEVKPQKKENGKNPGRFGKMLKKLRKNDSQVAAVKDETQEEKKENGESTRTGTNPEQPPQRTGVIPYLLFTDPWFWMFNVSTFFFCFGYVVPTMYIPDLAEEADIEDGTAAWAVSSVSISSIIGRLVFGLMADKVCFSAQRIYGVAMVIAGLGTGFSPLTNTMEWPFFTASVYGLFSAASSALSSIILIELIGLEALPDSLGWLTLFAGVPSLTSPFFAKWVTSATGHYTAALVIAGVCFAISGLVMLVVTHVRKRRGIQNYGVKKNCCVCCTFCCSD